ncbi:MAG TPA: PPE family protein [Mycobacterium sp.]|nr:PPE family protein [Mycobacterium sp.]
MDFGALPPELNSERIYAGPGSSPMLVAATAWGTLAAELRSAAAAYGSVIASLATKGWLGPSSISMASAAAPHAVWLNSTAEQAEETAGKATAAAEAFHTAFAMTVPPPAIAANRAQLMALIATNFLGQNAPAIAATEARYGEMWAQDAGAMYNYAGSSAAAAQVTLFTTPKQMTSLNGAAGQAAALAQATGTSSGTETQSVLNQLVSTVPGTLQALASPGSSSSAAATNPFSPGSSTAVTGLSGLINLLDGATGSSAGTFLNSSLVNGLVSGSYVSPALISPAITSALADLNSLQYDSVEVMIPPALGDGLIPEFIAPAGPPAAGLLGMENAAVTAGLGRAGLIGQMSVPQSWVAPPTSVTTPSTTPFGTAAWTEPPAAPTPPMPGMPGMPSMAGASGRGLTIAAPRYGFKPTVMATPPAAG